MATASIPKIRRVKRGTVLEAQGVQSADVYLTHGGAVRVAVDGTRIAEYRSGALFGELAHVEGGKRTSFLASVIDCRVASVPAEPLVRDSLHELSTGHRREESNAG